MKNELSLSKIIHQKSKFKNQNELKVKQSILNLQFSPILVTNTAEYEYRPQETMRDRLFVILKGSMVVNVCNKTIECTSGDLIIIPENTAHSLKIGKRGCKFFWSEKLND